jgi:hypothetical protein
LGTATQEFLAIGFKRTQDARSNYVLERATAVAQEQYKSLLTEPIVSPEEGFNHKQTWARRVATTSKSLGAEPQPLFCVHFCILVQSTEVDLLDIDNIGDNQIRWTLLELRSTKCGRARADTRTATKPTADHMRVLEILEQLAVAADWWVFVTHKRPGWLQPPCRLARQSFVCLLHPRQSVSVRSLGDFSKALEHHAKCLAIEKEVGDRAREGIAYANLTLPTLLRRVG